MFVDSHAHLDSPDFQSDVEAVLQRASDAGVSTIVTIGCLSDTLESLQTFLQLLEGYEGLYGCVGVHPHDARFYQPALEEEMGRLMEHPKILGWGEIGLDFYYENSPRPQQIEAFRQQLRGARAANKPVIIHSRDAEDLTCQILEEEFSQGPGGVLHCFTASPTTAERCLRLGFYISFGGILTFRRADDLRDIAGQIPGDRLLIETDSPYLAPVPYRGKRNEPAFVVKVAETLGQIRGVTSEEIGDMTRANFKRLFTPDWG
ncbi:TatD family hydrolase [Acidobacteria bacterium AH-259-D05]|nr:TatD family hydrolase [Acidobacteria bacterium AH-259-D05]